MYHITIMSVGGQFIASCSIGKMYDGHVYASNGGFPNPQEAAISALENALHERREGFDMPTLEGASESTQAMYANTQGMGI